MQNELKNRKRELTSIEIAQLGRKGRQKLADKKNIDVSSDGDVYDSPLTFHGKPRKRNYPKNRKPRDIEYYSTKSDDLDAKERKEAQMKLMTFAPLYTSIYTMTHGRSWTHKYLYVDVLAVVDNRMYRITKLVAKALGYPLLKSSAQFKVPDTVRIDYSGEIGSTESGAEGRERFIDDEEKLIETLSNTMFGYDKGYFWQSLHKLFAYDIPKPKREKAYKVKKEVVEPIDKPKKDYRLR